ncbi:unnamed protein product [Lathyrus sativus]|nr:unnamed protein product [Lathyrus sativus]
MIGSTSSGYMSSRRKSPVCGHELPMRIHISKSSSNPGRRYWKCKILRNDDDCHLFHWDAELFQGKQVKPRYGGCCSECENMKVNIRKYGVEFGKEFGHEFEKVFKNKKIGKLNMKAAKDHKTIQTLTYILVASWLFFAIMFCNR